MRIRSLFTLWRVLGFAAILVGNNGFMAGKTSAFDQDPDPGTVPITVTGTERLLWDQASSASELANLRFLIYVDDSSSEAQEVACASEPGESGYRCSSSLPPMTPGEHVLQASSVLADFSSESSRSAGINLIVMNPATGTRVSSASARTFITSDGIKLSASVVATGIEDATDLAVLGSGQIAIAERAGRIRLFRPASRSLEVAATLMDVDSSTPGSGLLAIAASGEPDREGAVYVVYTSSTGARLARFVSDGHGLTARAILFDGLHLSRDHPRASLRIGPDRKLYLGVDDGGKVDRVGDLGSMNGKVLRLNVDGTTPSDANGRVYAAGMNHPTAMAWSEDGSIFWMTGFESAGAHELRRNPIAARANGKEISRFTLPLRMGTSSMLRYRSDARSPLNGDLLIAGALGRSILRLSIAPTGSIETSEWLFDGDFDDVRAMAVDASGAIYLCTRSSLIQVVVQR